MKKHLFSLFGILLTEVVKNIFCKNKKYKTKKDKNKNKKQKKNK